MLKTKKWVRENDELTGELFNWDFETMEYKVVAGELRYLPNGNEPHPIRSDKVEEVQDLLEIL